MMFFIRCMFFWDVSLGDVNRSMPWYCETILGTRELHSIRSKDMGDIFSIETRKYACFYEFCLNPKGPHPILMWKHMQTDEEVV